MKIANSNRPVIQTPPHLTPKTNQSPISKQKNKADPDFVMNDKKRKAEEILTNPKDSERVKKGPKPQSLVDRMSKVLGHGNIPPLKDRYTKEQLQKLYEDMSKC